MTSTRHVGHYLHVCGILVQLVLQGLHLVVESTHHLPHLVELLRHRSEDAGLRRLHGGHDLRCRLVLPEGELQIAQLVAGAVQALLLALHQGDAAVQAGAELGPQDRVDLLQPPPKDVQPAMIYTMCINRRSAPQPISIIINTITQPTIKRNKGPLCLHVTRGAGNIVLLLVSKGRVVGIPLAQAAKRIQSLVGRHIGACQAGPLRLVGLLQHPTGVLPPVKAALARVAVVRVHPIGPVASRAILGALYLALSMQVSAATVVLCGGSSSVPSRSFGSAPQ
eukprot:9293438-Pyramimonas_sp.AAC.2